MAGHTTGEPNKDTRGPSLSIGRADAGVFTDAAIGIHAFRQPDLTGLAGQASSLNVKAPAPPNFLHTASALNGNDDHKLPTYMPQSSRNSSMRLHEPGAMGDACIIFMRISDRICHLSKACLGQSYS